MPFEFTTPFPETDPNCVAKFDRTFEHVDWIDGESTVQAESTPTEVGFNKRFHQVIDDLDALAVDARRGLECTAAVRKSLFAIMAEAETELSRLGASVESWTDAAPLLNGWRADAPDTNFDYPRPGYFRDLSGVVHLRGIADGGPVPAAGNGFNSVLFRLPPGHRPSSRRVLHVMSSQQQMCRLDITEQGDVDLRSEYSAWLSLEGASFRP